ncbi:PLP-dependent aminotransferase family protein [Lentzea albida]|uniref:(S)-3,5-dihydroxyphenylglycine transaminase n=1 Tax=Lentzea albida TaxID=65499 RepID=A0A1H9C1B1_9PSEU|nr:PLP-dependent aminotransferase family protein [Lentzea albida]SEP94757.1 (S)-3,5-dihydroxyphenylglycine transaminase [Lentzea albida]
MVTAADAGHELSIADLHPSLSDPALERMTFLNEVSSRFPDAVSFAAGRPHEEHFDVDALPRYLRVFQEHLAGRGADTAQIGRTLLQYGRTKGIIHELLARYLALDEGIDVDPESIVVTVGCQEAIFLTLRALCAGPDDVVLAVSPSYVGLTGAARLLDREVVPVGENRGGVDLDHFIDQVRAVRARGKRPRAFYLVPDFANPSGTSLDLETRKTLLHLAEQHDVLLLEDNPYGLFQAADGVRVPTLKALDTSRRVVYLGSLAKTCFPGARIGFAVADQRVSTGSEPVLLADELSKIKSMLTVNTSPLAQAMAGGKLLEHGCSLLRANEREIAVYRHNMRFLLTGLAQRFTDVPTVGWNSPGGGFFAVVTVPFTADDEALELSARRHGVLWTPMAHFYDGTGGANQLRLSISALSPQQIDTGLDRLRSMVVNCAR